MQCRQILTLLEPEKGTHRGTAKGKDVTSPKLATGQEGAVDNEPGPSGQRRSSRQAAARPAIVDVEESAGELEASPVAPSLKRKAVEVVPTVVKRVRIASGPINFEEELEHASVLLEEVRDEAVAVAERARAVDARLRDLDGWVRDLRKQVKASRK